MEPDNWWVEGGMIEFTTPTGLHEGYATYECIDDVDTLVTSLLHDGYVITSV